jgi:signal transduction histidine kinase
MPEGKRDALRQRFNLARLYRRVSRLEGKLIIPYVLLTLLLAIFGVYVITRLVTSTVQERFVNRMYEAAASASDAVVRQERINLENLRLIVFTQGIVEAVRARNSEALEALILPILVNNKIDAATIMDENGVEILTLGYDPAAGQYQRRQNTDLLPNELVKKVLSGVADEQGDKYADFMNTNFGPALVTGSPIYDEQRSLVGGALVGASLSQFLLNMKTQGLGSGEVIFFDHQKQIIITSLPEPEGGYQALQNFAQSIPQADMPRVHPLELYGRPYALTFTELLIRKKQLGWLGIAMPSDYVVSAEALSRNAYILIFTLGAVAMILLGYTLSQSIARPILKLRSLTQAVAAGDLNQDIGIYRSDEIGELASAFDIMTIHLRERTAEAARLYAEAIQRNKELAETNERLRATQQQLIQSEKLAAVGQLTAGIVHDVKNPLTVIKGVAELMLTEDNLPEETRSELSLIRDSAVKANNIVSDLLKFSRQSKPELEMHDLRATVEAALRLTAFPIRKGHVQVYKDLPEEPVEMVYDDQQIEQVLVNIITNAIHAMPNGGTLRVNLSTSNGVAAIAIQDTGIGMTPEVQMRIFDPFFTTKPEGEGTGLGLSVSYGIITNHEGRIDVHSVVGEGSTFTILLPIRQSAPVKENL